MCMDEFDYDGKKINFDLYGQLGSDYRYVEMNVIPCKPEQLSLENAATAKTSCVVDRNDKQAVADRLVATKEYIK
jgi:hypothetical protein